MKTSPEINEIAAALSKVQQEGLFALKDSNNPFFKSKYADLSSVWEVSRKPLTDNGLSVAQPLSYGRDGSPIITTLLMHTSGQWISGDCKIKPDKETPQAYGSAITYARRYSLASMLGVCPEDDDAESAMRRENKPIDEYVNDQQFADIATLIQEVGANEKAFLKYLKIESLDKMPVFMYERAVKELERKRK